MRTAFFSIVTAECMKRDDIIILSGDAGLGVFDELQGSYPDKFLNLGVAEQNMAGFAAGLAMTGIKVYMYNIIPFLFYRCYEQVRNDICDQELPVVLIGTGSGFTYAPAGTSHYSVEDIGLARTLPNLTVLSPIDPVEAKAAAAYSLKAKTPVYVRIAKSGEPVIHSTDDIDITAPQVIRDGDTVAIVFHGSISGEVMSAYGNLVKNDIHPMLLSVPMVQPFGEDGFMHKVAKMKAVVSVEEHYENTGLGSILSGLYTKHSPAWELKTIGIPYRVSHMIGDMKMMRKYSGISADDIVKTVRNMVCHAKHS